MFETKEIQKAVRKSQHCQRNWDLNKAISIEDLNTLKIAASECPSKQNIAFYKTYFITKRELIEKIYNHTDGFTLSYEPHKTTTNSQVLANLLIVFEPLDLIEIAERQATRNEQTLAVAEQQNEISQQAMKTLSFDQNVAIGVAAGYVNLSATLMGYATGCCSCFQSYEVKKILDLKQEPVLLMGVGYANKDKGRRIHHVHENILFPTKPKQKIETLEIFEE